MMNTQNNKYTRKNPPQDLRRSGSEHKLSAGARSQNRSPLSSERRSAVRNAANRIAGTPVKKTAGSNNVSLHSKSPMRAGKSTINRKRELTFFDKLMQIPLIFKLRFDILLKIIVCILAVIFFSLLQTTIFARFKPFGAIPDLMLVLTVAIGVSENEKNGAVFGFISALVISSIGGRNFVWLPLFYTPVGYICGYLSTYRFNRSFPVRAVYTLTVCILKSIITAAEAYYTLSNTSIFSIAEKILVPELFSTLLLAFPVHFIMWLCLKPFHKTRSEITKN